MSQLLSFSQKGPTLKTMQHEHLPYIDGQMQLYLEILVCKHVGKTSTSTSIPISPLKKNQQKKQQKKKTEGH